VEGAATSGQIDFPSQAEEARVGGSIQSRRTEDARTLRIVRIRPAILVNLDDHPPSQRQQRRRSGSAVLPSRACPRLRRVH